jgi:putative spermidine/putrescine transport system permease protein
MTPPSGKHAATLLLLALLFVLPVAALILASLAPGWRFPQVCPDRLSLSGWTFLSGNQGRILQSLGSSLAFSLLTVPVTLVLCLAPAAVFARTTFPGKTLLEGLLLTPALVPPMTFAMGLHHVFIRLGLADTVTGVVLILAMVAYPYMFRALVAGFQAVGEDYGTCARNLGAGPLTVLMKVELPLLLPAIVAGGSVVFLVAFSDYFLVFLVGGGSVASFTGTLVPLLGSSNRSLAAALTLVFLFMPVVLFVVVDQVLAALLRGTGIGRKEGP